MWCGQQWRNTALNHLGICIHVNSKISNCLYVFALGPLMHIPIPLARVVWRLLKNIIEPIEWRSLDWLDKSITSWKYETLWSDQWIQGGRIKEFWVYLCSQYDKGSIFTIPWTTIKGAFSYNINPISIQYGICGMVLKQRQISISYSIPQN